MLSFDVHRCFLRLISKPKHLLLLSHGGSRRVLKLLLLLLKLFEMLARHSERTTPEGACRGHFK